MVVSDELALFFADFFRQQQGDSVRVEGKCGADVFLDGHSVVVLVDQGAFITPFDDFLRNTVAVGAATVGEVSVP